MLSLSNESLRLLRILYGKRRELTTNDLESVSLISLIIDII